MPSAQTIGHKWREHARDKGAQTAIVHWVGGEEPVRWNWKDLVARADFYAEMLLKNGVQKGTVCALILRHHAEFYPLYMGIELAGAVPAVLAYPNQRLHPDKFRDGLKGMARRSGLDWILTETDLADAVLPLVQEIATTVLYPLDWANDPVANAVATAIQEASPSDEAVLQHSSGTTGLQKGVMLSHESILGHVATYADALSLTEKDCVVSWLPLYHDMGLIGAFHLPLAMGIKSVQIDPFEWVTAPSLLFDAISSERGTLVWLPNFAYNVLATRVHEDELDGIDLSSIRMLINCSEPVRAESHARFYYRFKSAGVRRESLAASYAMAEATFAVTQTPPGQQARVMDVSVTQLSRGKVSSPDMSESSRKCVSSGFPIPGVEIRIVNEAGAIAAVDEVGEIAIKSPFMFSGYRNSPVETAAVMRDGWYFTGDYGFADEGEYFIVGRKKDLIIVAGKNVYPEDIEAEASGVEGVTPGRVVAFGVTNEAAGTEEVWLLAESTKGADEHAGIAAAITRAAMAIDVTISRVIVLPPRWLIKSSAGKISRSANKERILQQLQMEQGE